MAIFFLLSLWRQKQVGERHSQQGWLGQQARESSSLAGIESIGNASPLPNLVYFSSTNFCTAVVGVVTDADGCTVSLARYTPDGKSDPSNAIWCLPEEYIVGVAPDPDGRGEVCLAPTPVTTRPLTSNTSNVTRLATGRSKLRTVEALKGLGWGL